MKKYLRVILTILFFTNHIFAQNHTEELYKVDKYRVDFQMDKAIKILQTEEKKTQNNSPDNLPEIYTAYLRYYISKDDFKKAKDYADKAYEYSQKTNNENAKGYGNLAQSYYLKQINDYDNSLEYAKKAQAIIEKNPNISPDLASRTYYILYGIHSRWEDFGITNHFANQSIKWAKRAKNYNILANAFSAKSTAMGFGLAKTKNKVYQDSITYYLRKANAVYEQSPQTVSEYTYAMTNINMASIFYSQLINNNTKATQIFILIKPIILR